VLKNSSTSYTLRFYGMVGPILEILNILISGHLALGLAANNPHLNLKQFRYLWVSWEKNLATICQQQFCENYLLRWNFRRGPNISRRQRQIRDFRSENKLSRNELVYLFNSCHRHLTHINQLQPLQMKCDPNFTKTLYQPT